MSEQHNRRRPRIGGSRMVRKDQKRQHRRSNGGDWRQTIKTQFREKVLEEVRPVVRIQDWSKDRRCWEYQLTGNHRETEKRGSGTKRHRR